jgi:hypothetical protein
MAAMLIGVSKINNGLKKTAAHTRRWDARAIGVRSSLGHVVHGRYVRCRCAPIVVQEQATMPQATQVAMPIGAPTRSPLEPAGYPR